MMTKPRTFKFKATDNGEYEVYENGTHTAFVRWYWDGWRAHALNGKDISSSGERTRSMACSGIPATGAA